MAILNLQMHIFVVNKTPAQASSHGYSLFFGSEHRLHLAPFWSGTTQSRRGREENSPNTPSGE